MAHRPSLPSSPSHAGLETQRNHHRLPRVTSAHVHGPATCTCWFWAAAAAGPDEATAQSCAVQTLGVMENVTVIIGQCLISIKTFFSLTIY